MKHAETRGRGMGVLVLLLFGIFAICIMMVLMLGADSYRSLVQQDEHTYEQRTGVQYVAAKLRHMDALGAVETGPFSDTVPQSCIFLHQEIGGEDYVTRIYYHDGYLRELFSDAELDMSPEDGQEILPASGMEASLDDRLITVSVTDAKGDASELKLSLRSGEGAAS